MNDCMLKGSDYDYAHQHEWKHITNKSQRNFIPF